MDNLYDVIIVGGLPAEEETIAAQAGGSKIGSKKPLRCRSQAPGNGFLFLAQKGLTQVPVWIIIKQTMQNASFRKKSPHPQSRSLHKRKPAPARSLVSKPLGSAMRFYEEETHMGGKKSIFKKVIAALLIILFVLLTVFLTGRYGWKLFGFQACGSAGIERVEVTDGKVRITGFYPGSFPQGFLGYHTEERDGTLYVGFRFSGLFGIFETGDFDITIPVKGQINEVIIKTKNYEYPIWPEAGSTQEIRCETESGAYESGVYVLLERSDVYSIGWHFENKSGGMTNADNTALSSGGYIHLENEIAQIAGNLERPVPFMLTAADSMGETVAQANMIYDPAEPVLFVTVTAEGEILVSGEKIAQPETPAAYEAVISRYKAALEEEWSGQQLVDAGMNHLILDVLPEDIGYAVDDLDGDGFPELTVGTVSGDEFYGKLVFALYTLDENGEAMLIFSSTERDRYYYAGGIRFANLGSSAFDDSFVTTLKLENREMIDMTYTTDPGDYVQMELVTFVQ